MAKRPTIILVPALLCDSRLYGGVKSGLESDFDVQIADTGQDDSIEAMACRLLEMAPERFALAGNSMGGYVALAAARMAPARVSHLALMGTNAHADNVAAREKREQAIRLAEGSKFGTFVDGYVDGALNPETAHEFGPILRAMARDLGADVLVRQQRAIMDRADMRAELAAMYLPTLVLYGEMDALAPLSVHEDMADALPNADLEIVPGCGHLIPLEQPVAVVAALRTLMAR